MRLLAFLLPLPLCFSCLRYETSIHFTKEEVTITIRPSTVRVDGEYFFRNRTGQSTLAKLYYPFAVDRYHPYPDSVHVEGLDVAKCGDGVTFILMFEPYETKEVRTAYVQRCYVNHARYILTSAREWGEPIPEALFTVIGPRDHELTVSYKPDSIIQKDRNVVCYIFEENLLPEREFDVWWTVP